MLGLEMCLLGTGWNVEHYYQDYPDTETAKILIVKYMKPICIDDEGEPLWCEGTSKSVIGEGATLKEILDSLKSGIEIILKMVKMNKSRYRQVVKSWNQLLRCYETICE